MKLKNTLYLFALFTLSVACVQEKKEETVETEMEEKSVEEKRLRHMVIFKFNEDSSTEDVDRLNKSFIALADSISVIQDFEWGLNDSPENFHQDFTHCYLVTFASEEDRDSIYAPHPAHQAFVESLGPHLEKVFVVDYWAQ